MERKIGVVVDLVTAVALWPTGGPVRCVDGVSGGYVSAQPHTPWGLSAASAPPQAEVGAVALGVAAGAVTCLVTRSVPRRRRSDY